MARIRTAYKRVKLLYKIRRYNIYAAIITVPLLVLTAIITFTANYKLLAGKLAIATIIIIFMFALLDNICKNMLKKNE